MFYEKLENMYNIILENIELKQFSILESNNEKDVEGHFKSYIDQVGWIQNKTYTRDRDIDGRYNFRNDVKGTRNGSPDYIFYDKDKNIIAICEVKSTVVGVIKGIDEARSYVEGVNEDYGLEIRVAIAFDGKNLVAEYLGEDGWERITIDNQELEQMPTTTVLKFIIEGENNIQTVEELSEIDKNLFRNFFKRCDEIFRYSKIGSSATDKFVELSTIIFLKMFSLQEYDKQFKDETALPSVWDLVLNGRTDIINGRFIEWLNDAYSKLYVGNEQKVLIKVDNDSLIQIAKLVDKVFGTYQLKDFTNVKGDILEFFQSESKDRKIGEFFTPRHIIKYMVKLIDPSVFEMEDDEIYIEKIYDPACGTGGFLIEVFDRYKNRYLSKIKDVEKLKNGVLHGTELKANTALLAKLNMILIGDGHTNIVNANAFSYKKIETLPKKTDAFGHNIVVPENEVEYYMEGSRKQYHVKGDRTRKVTLEAENKRYWLFDELGQRIDVKEEDIEIVNRVKKSKDGYYVKKQNGKYYKQIPVKHFELKNDLEEDKIPYRYEDVKSVNPLLTQETIIINGKEVENPYYHENFGNFDIVLANQPFGLSEPSKADYHFINHMLESLHEGKRDETGRYGRIACIVGNGFLHDKDFEDERRKLQENYTIKAIIALPSKTFAPYVQIIKSNILLIEKRKPAENQKTYFVQINHDGFSQDNKRTPELDKSEFRKLMQLWRKWEDDIITDPETDEKIIEPAHKELAGFAELHNLNPESWAVNSYIKYKVPDFNTEMVPLGDYIEECDEKIHPKDYVEDSSDMVEIKGVSKKYGIVTSDLKPGVEYNQKYKILGEGELAYNPSRINIGSIALNDKEEALISPSYVVFKSKGELLGKYIMFFLKSELGQKQVENFNFGAVRNSLSYEDLCKIQIPFMSVKEQERLLVLLENSHNALVNLLDSFSSLNKIGIPDSLFLEKYKDEHFSTYTLGDVINDTDKPSYGISIKADNEDEGYPILKMNNIFPIMDEILDDEEIDLITLEDKDFDKYRISKNDILINRTNCIDLVGKTGIYKWEKEAVFASYLMKVSIKGEFEPEYIAFYMNLSSVKDEIRKFAVQSNGQYNINLENLKKLTIKYPKESKLTNEYVESFRNYFSHLKAILKLSDTLQNELSGTMIRYLNKKDLS